MGYEIALALAEYGADVAVSSRTAAEIEKVQDEIVKLGRRALAVKADITKVPEIRAMVDKVVARPSAASTSLSTTRASMSRSSPLMLPKRHWTAFIDTNLKGLFFCARPSEGS